MLSRTAYALYWVGRYMERAEFTTRLLEATIRLSSLGGLTQSNQAWRSALAVVGETQGFANAGENLTAFSVSRHLILAEENANSIRSCLNAARDNARATRNAITREAWEAINRSWLHLRGRTSPGGAQATLNLAEELRAEIRGFEGAVARMLRNEAYWFIRLGSAIERGDNTARLLDVKYYILLPEGEEIGGALDRDQWTTILQTVSARNAYRLLYRDTLKPWLIADMLIFRQELPRSLTASSHEAVRMLAQLGNKTSRQGRADRMARERVTRLAGANIEGLFQQGLHEYLQHFVAENTALDTAIAEQFRFW